jgi:hypothetical protein
MRDPSTTHGRAITSFYVARRQCVNRQQYNGAHALACWVTTATDTHSECVMLAVPWQQWWTERAAILRFTYVACLVFSWHCSRIETSFISRRNWDLTYPHWTTFCGSVSQTYLARKLLWASENNYGFSHPSSLKYVLYGWYNPKLKMCIS